MPFENKSVYFNTRNFRWEGGQLISSLNSSYGRSWQNFRTLNTNPRWRAQVRQRVNAATAYTRLTRDVFPVTITGYGNFYDPTKSVSGKPVECDVSQAWDGSSPLNPSGLSTSEVDLLARQSFVSKYRAKRTAFQSGVFLGELMETVRMISSPGQALRKGINAYYADVKKRLRASDSRRRRNRRPERPKERDRRKNRIVRDTWLEYVFGWAPLINDIRDAAALATANDYVVIETISAGKTQTWKSDFQDINSAPYTIGGPLAWTERSYREEQVGVRYLGAIGAENDPPEFWEQFGFSWSNLAPTAWELIPYSFLVDYFSNIGKVIEGVSTGQITLRWGIRNQRQMSTRNLEVIFKPANVTASYGSTKWVGTVSGSGVAASFQDFSRTSIDHVAVGLADLMFKLPGTNIRWLNIAALAKMRK